MCSAYISTLTRFLQNRYCQMCQAKGDADVLIVATAVEAARERITVLVGLICHWWHGYELYFNQNQLNSRRRVRNMKTIKKQHVIFSYYFEMGHHFPSQQIWQSCSGNRPTVYTSESKLKCSTCLLSSTADDIGEAGENALISLYCSKPG